MWKHIVLKKNIQAVLYLQVVVLAFFAMSFSAFAQLPPPISPWMGMFDRTRGPGSISPYHQNVRPQQDAMRAYAAQANQLQSQQQALRALQSGGMTGGSSSGGGSGIGPRDLAGMSGVAVAADDMLLAPPREIPSMQRNPAGFNQYLHYYPPHSLPRKTAPYFSPTGRRR